MLVLVLAGCTSAKAQDTDSGSGAAGSFRVDEWASKDGKVRCYVRHNYNEGKVFCLRMDR